MKYFTLLITLPLWSACAVTEPVSEQGLSEIYLKAEAAYAEQQYVQAGQYYEQVIGHYPDQVNALFRLGNISMRSGHRAQAMQYYQRVLQLKPRHARAHHNLAMLYLHQASEHIDYYIAHNNTLDNKEIVELMSAIDRYVQPAAEQKTSLEKLADIVKP